jgi:hypothetical protein
VPRPKSSFTWANVQEGALAARRRGKAKGVELKERLAPQLRQVEGNMLQDKQRENCGVSYEYASGVVTTEFVKTVSLSLSLRGAEVDLRNLRRPLAQGVSLSPLFLGRGVLGVAHPRARSPLRSGNE